ncbi:hypothetical protein [Endozoicomonas sp. ONNA2]|uniref:hypothetical protein n=1 Tax=Endozoicomonas sp. ONNA2 TaxID=2828741 RepID=UPI00214971BC|nr:hypothetical protein [Endozoicomonas sp. ONNA2]
MNAGGYSELVAGQASEDKSEVLNADLAGHCSVDCLQHPYYDAEVGLPAESANTAALFDRPDN